jgi:uncharacterized membrane protein YgcG
MEPVSSALKKTLAYALSFVLVFATIPEGGAWPQSAPPENTGTTTDQHSSAYTGQGAPLTTEEIDSLVSPIALYPDALVAQILSAATFPDQIAVANYWMQQHKDLTGSALMQQVNTQSWDPSVKALTQFPTVLNNMAQNLSWTSQLGDAYHNQSPEMMAAVQALRKQAQTAGNLKTTPQQTVKTETQNGTQVIVIQPSSPQVVYVPSYNPTVVYGTPYIAPGYSTADLVATGLLSFGAGIAVGAMMSGGCCGWGYSSWNCHWYGGGVYYHGGAYYGNAAWHGGYYGGYNNRYGYHPNYNNGYQHYGNNNYNRSNYNSGNLSHNTTIRGNTVNVNRGTGGSDSWDKSGWANSDAAKGWGSHSGDSRSSAFSGYGDHSSSGFSGGGWGDRTSSSRGWGSRGGGGGWGGGRFGGGGGFRGGGFRR